MDTNTVQLIESFGNKLDHYIQTVAEKGGQGVEHFWPILVKQQAFEGEVFFVVVVSLVALSIILLLGGIFYGKKSLSKSGENASVVNHIFTVIGMVAILFSIMALCFGAQENFLKIKNPEYYALKEVAKMIGQ